MTDEERLQLQRDTVARCAQLKPSRRRPLTGRAAKAARYALDHACTLTDAGVQFGVTVSAVSRAWCKLFPTTQATQRRSDLGAHPEDECAW